MAQWFHLEHPALTSGTKKHLAPLRPAVRPHILRLVNAVKRSRRTLTVPHRSGLSKKNRELMAAGLGTGGNSSDHLRAADCVEETSR